MTGIMAITMAGMGSRFTKAGYNVPKYEIEVRGRPLFDWSMLSLEAFRQAGWRFRFAARTGTGAQDYVRSRCKVLGIDIESLIELESVTDGQATTAFMLSDTIKGDCPFAVYNIDTFVTPNAMIPPAVSDCAGWIPCFKAPGDAWSFVRLNGQGKAVEVREKERISDFATLGLYWFDSMQRYRDLYQTHFADAHGMEKGERYIAPMYNRLIEQGLQVRISDIPLDEVGMLGTPEQVEAFAAHPPRFVLAE